MRSIPFGPSLACIIAIHVGLAHVSIAARGFGVDRLHDIVADCVENELADGMKSEFAHDVATVGLGRFDAQLQKGGDILGAFSFGEQLDDLAFARGESFLVERSPVAAEVGTQSGLIEARREVSRVTLNLFDGADEFAASVGLENQSFCAELECGFRGLIGVIDGEKENFCFGVGAEDFASGIESVQIGHSDVEGDKVWFQLLDFLNGVSAVDGFGADLPSGVRFNERTNSLAHDLVIIGNQNAKV